MKKVIIREKSKNETSAMKNKTKKKERIYLNTTNGTWRTERKNK